MTIVNDHSHLGSDPHTQQGRSARVAGVRGLTPVRPGVFRMREIKASEFKAKCLALIDEVAETGEAIVVTKYGKPVVRVEADRPAAKGPLFGCLKGMVELVDPDDDLDVKTDAGLKWWRDRQARLAKSMSKSAGTRTRKKGH